MRGWLIALPLLGGCDLMFRLKDVGPPVPDADPSTIDADLGTVIDAGICTGSTKQYGRSGPMGKGLFSMCMTPSLGTLDLSGLINAGEDARCLVVDQDTAGTTVCVLVAGTITVSATLRVSGARPLVLLATDTLQIAATLNVSSSTANGYNGAGSNWSGCAVTAAGPNNGLGGGGGAGGTFTTSGGNGGGGGIGTLDVIAKAKLPAEPDRIRGGCAGGSGGSSNATPRNASGGTGGGAIYLIAGTSIELTATAAINASGAGGDSGARSGITNVAGGGGGGGGSGGLIALDAPTIIIDPNAKLMANGGGGGSGGNSDDGKNGADPSLGNVLARAQGGAGGNGAGGGGLGAAIAGATNGGTNNAGGGGGGGAGAIRLYSATVPTTVMNVSPPWQVN